MMTIFGVGVGVGGKLLVTTTVFEGAGVGVTPTIRARAGGVGTGFNSCEKLVETEIRMAQNNIKLLFIQQIYRSDDDIGQIVCSLG